MTDDRLPKERLDALDDARTFMFRGDFARGQRNPYERNALIGTFARGQRVIKKTSPSVRMTVGEL